MSYRRSHAANLKYFLLAFVVTVFIMLMFALDDVRASIPAPPAPPHGYEVTAHKLDKEAHARAPGARFASATLPAPQRHRINALRAS